MSRELDAEVAERIFGYTLDWEFSDLMPDAAPCVHELRDEYDEWGVLPNYSTDIAAAWQVIDYLRERNIWLYSLEQRWSNLTRAIFEWQDPEHGSRHALALEDTPMLAICAAALKAVGEDAR